MRSVKNADRSKAAKTPRNAKASRAIGRVVKSADAMRSNLVLAARSKAARG